ncbi:MAG: Pyridoxamine 5'-phosphate oxidase [uncultured Thermomicrobiales bacterium]|uniref:Pyridoxamine 5'-phosphate oxidase n=1 Tax=uncultured Thermomicrobiales bacterium TaxID=1645740 RepID=A0A6J4UD38_9BACT|nr:MAG: Pyridoxamine 5'-phosphate oxidase [uncultured Thermomicrobiales bacterium]
MTDHAPVETTNLGPAELTAMEWSLPRDLLAAPPPPDTPGGHHPSYLVTVRPNGRPHATRVGARWHEGNIYFLSGPGTRKSRNLAVNPACTIAMRLEGLDVVLDGEAASVHDPATLDAVGALIRQSGWPVEVTAGGFTAPFGPADGGPPPWPLYRFVFHTAIGQAGAGATRWRFAR